MISINNILDYDECLELKNFVMEIVAIKDIGMEGYAQYDWQLVLEVLGPKQHPIVVYIMYKQMKMMLELHSTIKTK